MNRCITKLQSRIFRMFVQTIIIFKSLMPAEGSAQARFVQESERDVQKTSVRISLKFSVRCHYLPEMRHSN